MKVVFDTSVIVAGSIAGHPHEPRAAAWLRAAREGRLAAAATAHALAETWATLTALPGEPRIAPALVERVVERFLSHVEVLELGWSEYDRAIRRCGDRALRSGAVYDALHLVAAEHWEADLFLTFNVQDFERLAVAGGPSIAIPPDPPGVDALLGGPGEPPRGTRPP